MTSIRFLGAAGTVTGSRFLVESGAARVLVDAGLFQGPKELRLRNRAAWPVDPASIDAVVLTHAHVDHTGALPQLARDGFRGRVTCTAATRDLAAILLPDSGRLQEEEARWANRKGYSKHAPDARPLYTEEDALAVLPRLSAVSYGERREVAAGVAVRLHRAGHILGSATVELELVGPRPRRILFSGDLGRSGAPIVPDPEPGLAADALVLESTYAGRRHPPGAAEPALRDEVLRAVAQRGALVIPAFAIGRTQEVLFTLRALEKKGAIPELPTFVDSPPRTTVLLVGFQAGGTRGWSLQNGAQTVRIHGEDVPVKARIASIAGFSAHADEDELTRWLGSFPAPPRRTFLVHGEPPALAAAKERMDRLGWACHVPRHLEEIAV
jgi:metallo-beta-lactamase family protein